MFFVCVVKSKKNIEFLKFDFYLEKFLIEHNFHLNTNTSLN